jgi:MGT family glycosyltransferase
MSGHSFLFVLWDGGGNVAPQLAIAKRLAERGNRIRVLASRTLDARVEATGATFRPFTRSPDGDPSDPKSDVLRDWEARTPLGAFANVRDHLMCGPALAFANDVVDELADDPADMVVIDFMLFGAAVGAAAAGVPLAILFHTVYAAPAPGVPPYGMGLAPARGWPGRVRDAILSRAVARAFAPGLKTLNAAGARFGLEPLANFGELVDRAALALVLTSPSFDFAAQAQLPSHVRYTGPVLDRASTAENWNDPWASGHSDPLVVASFSSTFMKQRELARRVLAALGGLPVRGLLTTGPALDVRGLSVPANVVVRDWAPHELLFQRANLVVSHCGLGTVHAALAAGAPLVCLPCGRDQGENAARVVAAGAGLRVTPRASVRRLRGAIQTALADDAISAGAKRMAGTFAREDGVTSATDALEELAFRTATSSSPSAK